MKLSKGVLGLKFMRRTKEQIDKDKTEKKHREYFGDESSSKKIKLDPDSASGKARKTRYIVCPSYMHCEQFCYARQSYGGMNPTVEENVRKGIWKVDYEFPEFDKDDAPEADPVDSDDS